MSKREIRIEKVEPTPTITVVDGAPYIQAAKDAIQLEVGFVRNRPFPEQVQVVTNLIKKDRDTFIYLSPYQVLKTIFGDRMAEISEHDQKIFLERILVAQDGWLLAVLGKWFLQLKQF